METAQSLSGLLQARSTEEANERNNNE